MRLFSKKTNQAIEELEKRYANQAQQRAVAATWPMTLLSLVITFLIFSGLFFGGRFLYRAITNNNEISETPTSITSVDPIKYDGVVSDTAASTDVPSTIIAAENTDAPTTYDYSRGTDVLSTEDSELPNTGAGSTLIVVALAFFALGYVTFLRRQLKIDLF
jgi:hypothetical protein